jgi:hypothetical protein
MTTGRDASGSTCLDEHISRHHRRDIHKFWQPMSVSGTADFGAVAFASRNGLICRFGCTTTMAPLVNFLSS